MSDDNERDVWVTKYALTDGVQRVRVTASAIYAYSTDRYKIQYGKGEWYTTRDGAVAKAEQMRTRKIESLHKQLKRLREMTF